MFVDRGLLWSVYFWYYGSVTDRICLLTGGCCGRCISGIMVLSLIHLHFRFSSLGVPLKIVDRRML
jgi:hypothetical protein